MSWNLHNTAIVRRPTLAQRATIDAREMQGEKFRGSESLLPLYIAGVTLNNRRVQTVRLADGSGFIVRLTDGGIRWKIKRVIR